MRLKNLRDLCGYLHEARENGTIHLVIDAWEWGAHMEKMMSNYVGPPLPMDWEQLSHEGIAFLVNFWIHGDRLQKQIASETAV